MLVESAAKIALLPTRSSRQDTLAEAAKAGGLEVRWYDLEEGGCAVHIRRSDDQKLTVTSTRSPRTRRIAHWCYAHDGAPRSRSITLAEAAQIIQSWAPCVAGAA